LICIKRAFDLPLYPVGVSDRSRALLGTLLSRLSIPQRGLRRPQLTKINTLPRSAC